jgi:hypothetical protein
MSKFQFIEDNGTASIVASDEVNAVTIYQSNDPVHAKQVFAEFTRDATRLGVGV